ncbi:MAG: P-loop containing nucleoside triphosphate hydrolase protein [Piptocephalis tieghemiana]|nr:MAG: P-loop containing nucleoside triphosphate hydrolase protein [Piptocephalis tieghemiana]
MHGLSLTPPHPNLPRSFLIKETLAYPSSSLHTSSAGGNAFNLLHPKVKALLPDTFQIPTTIQQSLIPTLLTHRSFLATSKTGEGKTAAYALPILSTLVSEEISSKTSTTSPKALILVPSSVLAKQVEQVLRTELGGKALGIRTGVLTAEEGMEAQMRQLSSRDNGRGGGVPSILVSTPGRLVKHLAHARDLSKHTPNPPYLSLRGLRWWVMDEGDRMFSMGLFPDLLALWDYIPKDRIAHREVRPQQKSPIKAVDGLEWLREEATSSSSPITSQLTQIAYRVTGSRKLALVEYLARRKGKVSLRGKQTLLFLRTIRRVERMTQVLRERGWSVACLHSEISPTQRAQALEEIRSGKAQFLLATDIAARGMDLEGLEVVVNLDLPLSHAEYVHRVGRVARAGRGGLAISLVSKEPEWLQLSDGRWVQRDEGSLVERIEQGMSRPEGGEDRRNLEWRKVPGPWKDEARGGPGTDSPGWVGVGLEEVMVAARQAKEPQGPRIQMERKGRGSVRKVSLFPARKPLEEKKEPVGYERAVEEFTRKEARNRGVTSMKPSAFEN